MAYPSQIFLIVFTASIIAAVGTTAGTTAGTTTDTNFDIEEASIADIQAAFKDGRLTSRQLVEHYLANIAKLNPRLNAVIEVNPDAIREAARADFQRSAGHPTNYMHGIPVLLKDTIATRDRLNTTAGSYALLGSVVPRDAGVVRRLRCAGAIILGKASLSEWADFRGLGIPAGWSARGGQGVNPYNATMGPCGSSSGPAIAVAANLVTAVLGTETDGSIICPASSNSVVGIKPTVGLTSRAGVIPVSLRQDSVGPIGRTVADAVAILDTIVGVDRRDANATKAAARFIPRGGYQQFLKLDGLKGKRVGILRRFFDYATDSVEAEIFANHFKTMRQKGAILIDGLDIQNATVILNLLESGESVALIAEFKIAINLYLKNLVSSPVRSLADIIELNIQHSTEESIQKFGQAIFLAAENTSGIGLAEEMALQNLARLSAEGLEKLMTERSLDAVVFPDASAARVLAIGGYPAITVPAGYNLNSPVGISFGGLLGFEPQLIEIAYSFEQATKARKPIPPTSF